MSDKPTQRDHSGSDLSLPMRHALGEMPITMVHKEGYWFLPQFGPTGGTLDALRRRGLVEYSHTTTPPRWHRTALGEAVWGEPMTDHATHLPSARSYSRALARARAARGQFISLTHDLPKDAPQDVLRLWNVADTALLAFIRELELQEGTSS